jgi:hypothetical protein
MSTTATDARTVYSLEGTLLEICSCGVMCPCFGGEDPDGGSCVGVIAYQLERGEIEGVDVSGLSILNVAQIPGNALQGSWRVVLLIDDRATEEQEQVMLRAFGGELGGFLGDLAGLVDELVAVERAPIAHAVENAVGTISVDGVLEADLEPIIGANGNQTTLSGDGLHHGAGRAGLRLEVPTLPGEPAPVRDGVVGRGPKRHPDAVAS